MYEYSANYFRTKLSNHFFVNSNIVLYSNLYLKVVKVSNSQLYPGSPIKENIPPPTTPGKPARTPKSSSEVDLNKINITPRSKVPRGFTKNLTSQWENMNR